MSLNDTPRRDICHDGNIYGEDGERHNVLSQSVKLSSL
jgi:hypothetical protein